MTSTTASSEALASVDLSELLSFNVTFKNLELVLRTVLTRLDNVEHAVADNRVESTTKDQELADALDDLKRQVEEQKDIQDALSERCVALSEQVAEADRLAKAAQDTADDAHRRLDALGNATPATKSATPPTVPISQPVKDYGDEIAALQRAVENLAATKADKKVEEEIKSLDVALTDALDQLRELKQNCDDVDQASKHRDNELGKRIDSLLSAAAGQPRASSVIVPPVNNDWEGPLNNLSTAVEGLKAAQDAINAKLAALAGMRQPAADGSTPAQSDVSSAQFMMLQAAVDALEKRALPKDYDQAIELLKQQLRALGNECSANTAQCHRLDDVKANKDDLEGLIKKKEGSPPPSSSVPAAVLPPSDSWVRPLADCNRRIDDLQKLMSNLEGLVRGADLHRLDRNVQSLSSDVDKLRAALDALRKTPTLPQESGVSGAPSASAADQAIVDAMQKQLGDVVADTAKHMDWTKGQVLEIRATIEHIHHTKADTSLVANKAERDFVENSMEKLMREVEQVLNATNAGLIDTLDKSLNILRDMIDGKATKQDVVKLQSMIGEEQLGGVGGVPEGLTGFKGYRCLGCNRTMDGMRQRPMGANFSTFTNRLPPNSSAGRPASQQQQAISGGSVRAVVAGPSPPAGYIGNTPQSR